MSARFRALEDVEPTFTGSRADLAKRGLVTGRASRAAASRGDSKRAASRRALPEDFSDVEDSDIEMAGVSPAYAGSFPEGRFARSLPAGQAERNRQARAAEAKRARAANTNKSMKRSQNAIRRQDELQAARADKLEQAYARRGDLSDRDNRAFGRISASNTGLKPFKTVSPSVIRKILSQYPMERKGFETRVLEDRTQGGFWPISQETAARLYDFARANSRVDQKTWDSFNSARGTPREYRVAKWVSNNIKALYPGLRAEGLHNQIVADFNANSSSFYNRASTRAQFGKAAENLTAIASRKMGARSLKGLTFEGTAMDGLTLTGVDSVALRSELNRMLRGRSQHPKQVQNVLAALAYTEQVIAIAQQLRNQRLQEIANRLSGPEAAQIRAAMRVGSADVIEAEKIAQRVNKVQGKKLTTGRRITRKNNSNIRV